MDEPLPEEYKEYLCSPVEIDGRPVYLSRYCVERYRLSLPQEPTTFTTRMKLRQRLEQGRILKGIPHWLPAGFHDHWDALINSDGLIYGVRDRGDYLKVALCFDKKVFELRICNALTTLSSKERDNHIAVSFSDHVLERYIERIASGASKSQAKQQLEKLITEYGQVVPEPPSWMPPQRFQPTGLFIAIKELELLLPLRVSSRTKTTYVATTILAKGLNQQEINKSRDARQRDKINDKTGTRKPKYVPSIEEFENLEGLDELDFVDQVDEFQVQTNQIAFED